MAMRRHTAVIGAGILGLTVARRLAEVRGDEVTVFEKEPEVARHQTGILFSQINHALGTHLTLPQR